MKYKIIRINDISDIDTSKISVYDLNNRYVDQEGQMYCLRYNKGDRKIEIVKLMRAYEEDVNSVHRQIAVNKNNYTDITSSAPADNGPLPDNTFSTETVDTNEDMFDAKTFIINSLETIITHRERIRGIIMNIKNSNIFPKENKSESNELEDIFRNLELDCLQSIDDIENYNKELSSYPRSITYYQAKVDNNAREIIENLTHDSERQMRFVYIYEMHHTIKEFYTNLHNTLKNLSNLVNEKNPKESKGISQFEIQAFLDGKVSIKTTLDEIENIQDDIRYVEDYIYNPDNF